MTSSLWRMMAGPGRRSVTTAFFCRFSGMPPNRATSGFLPAAFDPGFEALRGPCGVSMVALYLRAIFDTDERCLPARVLSMRGLHDPVQPVKPMDVTGQQVVLDDAPVLGPVGADDGVVVVVDQRGRRAGLPRVR